MAEQDRYYGSLLRELREESGVSQKRVGQVLGLTEGAYRHYEAGRSSLGLERLSTLAHAIEVSTDYFLFRMGLIPDQGSGVNEPTIYTIKRDISIARGLLPEDKKLFIEVLKRLHQTGPHFYLREH